MRGDWAGAPRRAIPAADTHVNPGQGPCPNSPPKWSEDDVRSQVCTADFCQARPV
jgi:hypothetical protein